MCKCACDVWKSAKQVLYTQNKHKFGKHWWLQNARISGSLDAHRRFSLCSNIQRGAKMCVCSLRRSSCRTTSNSRTGMIELRQDTLGKVYNIGIQHGSGRDKTIGNQNVLSRWLWVKAKYKKWMRRSSWLVDFRAKAFHFVWKWI